MDLLVLGPEVVLGSNLGGDTFTVAEELARYINIINILLLSGYKILFVSNILRIITPLEHRRDGAVSRTTKLV